MRIGHSLFFFLVYILGWTCAETRAQSQNWQTFTTSDGLASGEVRKMLEASDGSMWFGTGVGVSRYEGT